MIRRIPFIRAFITDASQADDQIYLGPPLWLLPGDPYAVVAYGVDGSGSSYNVDLNFSVDPQPVTPYGAGSISPIQLGGVGSTPYSSAVMEGTGLERYYMDGWSFRVHGNAATPDPVGLIIKADLLVRESSSYTGHTASRFTSRIVSDDLMPSLAADAQVTTLASATFGSTVPVGGGRSRQTLLELDPALSISSESLTQRVPRLSVSLTEGNRGFAPGGEMVISRDLGNKCDCGYLFLQYAVPGYISPSNQVRGGSPNALLWTYTRSWIALPNGLFFSTDSNPGTGYFYCYDLSSTELLLQGLLQGAQVDIPDEAIGVRLAHWRAGQETPFFSSPTWNLRPSIHVHR